MKSPDGRHELVDPATPEKGWRRAPNQAIARAPQASQGAMNSKGSWLSRKWHPLMVLIITLVAAIRAIGYYNVNRHG